VNAARSPNCAACFSVIRRIFFYGGHFASWSALRGEDFLCKTENPIKVR
jgi:hypothetical protein